MASKYTDVYTVDEAATAVVLQIGKALYSLDSDRATYTEYSDLPEGTDAFAVIEAGDIQSKGLSNFDTEIYYDEDEEVYKEVVVMYQSQRFLITAAYSNPSNFLQTFKLKRNSTNFIYDYFGSANIGLESVSAITDVSVPTESGDWEIRKQLVLTVNYMTKEEEEIDTIDAITGSVTVDDDSMGFGISYEEDRTFAKIKTMSLSFGRKLSSLESTLDQTITLVTEGVDGQTLTATLNDLSYTGEVADGEVEITLPTEDLEALDNDTRYRIVNTVTDVYGSTATRVLPFTTNFAEIISTAFSWGTTLDTSAFETIPYTLPFNLSSTQTVTVVTNAVEGQTLTMTLNSVEYTAEVIDSVATLLVPSLDLAELEADTTYTAVSSVTDTDGIEVTYEETFTTY